MRILCTATWMLVLMAFVIGVASFAQVQPGVQRLSIPRFDGINNAAGPLTMKPTEALIANNVLLSSNGGNIGSMSKRLGYDSVSALGDFYDSLISIYGVFFSDGKRCLAYVADSAHPTPSSENIDYGGVYVSNLGTHNLDSSVYKWHIWFGSHPPNRLTTYWNCQHQTSFTTFGDVLYAVNGVQKGIAWDGKNVRSFPLAAPGEPKIVPIGPDTGDYKFSGEYRYTFKTVAFDGSDSLVGVSGYVSAPIRVTDGRVLMTEFTWPANDSVRTSVDSVHIYPYRTKVNPGRLDKLDTAWLVQTGYITAVSDSALALIVFIDSIPDTLLQSTNLLLVNATRVGHDSTGTMGSRYGAPGFVSLTSQRYIDATDTVGDSIHFGVLKGIGQARRLKTKGILYHYVYFDTVTYSGGDTSVSCFVAAHDSTWGADTLISRVRVSFPPIPDSLTGLVRNLYKSYVFPVGRDSGVLVKEWRGPYTTTYVQRVVDDLNNKAGWDKFYVVAHSTLHNSIFMHSMTQDTIVTTLSYLIAQVPAESLAFTDSTRYDSAITHDIFRGTQAPPLLKSITTFAGRIMGIDGSRLYWSKADSAAYWGVFEFTGLNEDDGDEGVIAWPTRTAIRYAKNNSIHNIYDDFSKSEISGYFGCVAPQSHVAGLGAHYYVTANGIVRETDGPMLERTFTTGLISDRLAMFASMPMSVKQRIVGAYLPKSNKAFFDIPFSGGDTVLIWDELANGWTTSTGFSFGGATLYDTSSVATHVPANTMYFFKRGGKTLYTYGTSDRDNGAYIDAEYESGPLLTDWGYEQIQAVGITTHSGVSTDELFFQAVSDKGARLHVPVDLAVLDSTYYGKEIGAAIPAWYTKIRLYSHPVTAYWTNTVIDGLDIFFKKTEEYPFR